MGASLYDPINVYKPVAPNIGIVDGPVEYLTIAGIRLPLPFTTCANRVHHVHASYFVPKVGEPNRMPDTRPSNLNIISEGNLMDRRTILTGAAASAAGLALPRGVSHAQQAGKIYRIGVLLNRKSPSPEPKHFAPV